MKIAFDADGNVSAQLVSGEVKLDTSEVREIRESIQKENEKEDSDELNGQKLMTTLVALVINAGDPEEMMRLAAEALSICAVAEGVAPGRVGRMVSIAYNAANEAGRQPCFEMMRDAVRAARELRRQNGDL